MTDAPRIVGGVRREATLWSDDQSTLSRGWCVQTGRPALVRVARPGAPAWSAWCPPGFVEPRGGTTPVPWLRLDLPGPALASLLPLDGPLGPSWTARALVHGLRILQAGAPPLPLAWLLAVTSDRLVPCWIGPGRAGSTLSPLATLAVALDPTDPLAALVAEWEQAPPPSLADAEVLLIRGLATALAREHHALQRRQNHQHRGSHRARLRAAVLGLRRVLAPPPATATLPQRARASLEITSDGTQVRLGGAGPGLLVWHPARGLDPVAARLALRAWALSRSAVPPSATLLLRWLRAQSTLRRAALLLAQSEKDTVSR